MGRVKNLLETVLEWFKRELDRFALDIVLYDCWRKQKMEIVDWRDAYNQEGEAVIQKLEQFNLIIPLATKVETINLLMSFYYFEMMFFGELGSEVQKAFIETKHELFKHAFNLEVMYETIGFLKMIGENVDGWVDEV